MLALFVLVSKVKADITYNLVSLCLVETVVLPDCQPDFITDSSKTSTEPLRVLHWLLVGVGLDVGQSPSFSAESPLTTIDLVVGKPALRLSYPCFWVPTYPIEREGSLGELCSSS